MIPVPNGRLFFLFALPLPMILASFVLPEFLNWAIICNLAIFIIAVLDIAYSFFTTKLEFEHNQHHLFSIGRNNRIKILVHNIGKRKVEFEVKLGLPESVLEEENEIQLSLPKNAEEDITFTVRPIRRGSYQIKNVYFKAHSVLGLVNLYGNYSLDFNIDVYPDIEKLNHFLKLMRMNRENDLGIHRNRWQGIGTELESLREYQQDDDSKNIDWKASTRLNKPVTKVFQMETSNHITIAIDCGRLMTAEQNGLNTLDHAVNSLLILTHIAFRLGDSISIIAYSDRIIAELPESKGKANLKTITQFITKLEPEYVESNYQHAFNYIYQKIKRRSLVIFLTDMIDDINYQVFRTGLTRLSRKHLVLFILLRDIILSEESERGVMNSEMLYTSTAAREMLLSREKAINKLKYQHTNILDVLPNQLSGRLINKYLEMKAKNRI